MHLFKDRDSICIQILDLITPQTQASHDVESLETLFNLQSKYYA